MQTEDAECGLILQADPASPGGPLAGQKVVVDDNDTNEATCVQDGDVLFVRGNFDNFEVEDGASITLEDDDGKQATFVNGENADLRVTADGDLRIRVTDDPIIVPNDNSPNDKKLDRTEDIRVVTSTGIRPQQQQDTDSDEPIIVIIDNSGGDGSSSDGSSSDGSSSDGSIDTNGDEVISQEEQLNAAEGDLNALDETTDGETTSGTEQTVSTSDAAGEDTSGTGASASSGPDGSSAQAGGAGAESGGRSTADPDNQAPVGQQQAEEQYGGEVVDEVQTTGPLPETGGASVAVGTSLALVLFGVLLLSVRLVAGWRERS